MSILPAAAALGLIFHIGGSEVHRFERLAAADLRSHLSGDAAAVSVKVTLASLLGGPLGELDTVTVTASGFSCAQVPLYMESCRSHAGRIRTLHIELRDFVLAGLRVESLVADIPDCRFDLAAAIRRHRFILSRGGSGTARVRIREDALGAFALHKFPLLTEASVRIDKDKVFVDGSGRSVFAAKFSVIAGLEAVDGRRIFLSTPRVFVDGHSADPLTTQAMWRALNPVVDLDKDLGLRGAISLQGMRLRDGVLEGWGAASLPDLPPPTPGASGVGAG